MNKRKLLPWEQNWLIKHGMGKINIDDYGEMPVEYITGYAGILGREFKVDERVLIPRVEEEDFIGLAMEVCPKKEKLVIADVGTGSGCIGMSLYLEFKKMGIESEVYLSDISEEVLEVAVKNLHSLKNLLVAHQPFHGCSCRCHRNGDAAEPLLAAQISQLREDFGINLIKSDLMSDYPKDLKFDLIVANLPYIPDERMKKLPKSVKDYEPLTALDGGKNGLVLIKKLIKQLPMRLNKNGVAILEIDETHKLEDFSDCLPLRESLPRSASWRTRGGNLFGKIKKDQFGKNRFLVIRN